METSKVDEKVEGKQEKKPAKAQEDLPFCTTAHSAEQARGDEVEGPCDDYTTGDYKK